MSRSLQLVPGLIAAAALALAACGGGSTSAPPPGGVPASSPAASTAATAPSSAPSSAASSAPSTASTAASTAPAGAAAANPSSTTAPGPYTANGSITAANGQAAIQALDTLKWQPNTITVKPGDKITLNIDDAGNTAHSFISPGLGVSNAQAIATGKTTPVTFTAPSSAGTYQFWCDIPGHAEAGMVGEVIVQ